MNLEEFNYIAEIVASIAVIASLVYVAIQIRQNTSTNKLMSAQNLSHELRETLSLVAASTELTDIHLRAMQDIESLSTTEKHRFYMLLNNVYRVYESTYYQSTQGVVDDAVLNGVLGNMHIGKNTSGYQSFWQDRKSIFSKEFQDYYDSDTEGLVNMLDIYQETAPDNV
jgi:hypothetical protein